MKLKLSDLLEKRAKLVTEGRALNDVDAPTQEQAARLEEVTTELEALEKRIHTQALLDEADRRAEGQPLNGGDPQLDKELRAFSLTKAIASQVPDIAGQVDAGREREVSTELQRRYGMPAEGITIPLQCFEVERRVVTGALPSAGPGGNLVPTDHLASEYIDLLRANLVTGALGARVLSGLHGNVQIPGLQASAGSAWVADNSAITPTDPQFRKVTMVPHHVGVITEYSRNMLLQTSPDIERLLRQDFAATLARAIDSAALIGGASAAEPDGIISTAAHHTVDMTPATWAKILEFISDVEVANAAMGRLGWATHPTVTAVLRAITKVSSDAGAGFLQDEPNSIAGYPAVSSSAVIDPSTSPDSPCLIFGNWADLVIGYWDALSILVNPYESTAYTKGNVMVRGMLTADVAQRHVESFAAAIGVSASG